LGSLEACSAAGSTSGPKGRYRHGLLGGFGEGLEGTFEIGDGLVDGVEIVAADGVFHGLDLAFQQGLEFGGSIVTQFTELFFDIEDEVVGLVLGIDLFDTLLVFLGVGLGIALGLFDLVLGETGGTLDRDLLFLAGLLVLGGNVENSVRVDIEVTSICGSPRAAERCHPA